MSALIKADGVSGSAQKVLVSRSKSDRGRQLSSPGVKRCSHVGPGGLMRSSPSDFLLNGCRVTHTSWCLIPSAVHVNYSCGNRQTCRLHAQTFILTVCSSSGSLESEQQKGVCVGRGALVKAPEQRLRLHPHERKPKRRLQFGGFC